MKHKGERNIPNFAKAPKTPKGVTPDRKGAPQHDRAQQPKAQSKPQSTSSKSGRRGI
jgi:hypothetical protein